MARLYSRLSLVLISYSSHPHSINLTRAQFDAVAIVVVIVITIVVAIVVANVIANAAANVVANAVVKMQLQL